MEHGSSTDARTLVGRLRDAGVPDVIAQRLAAAGPHADAAAMCAASDLIVGGLADAEVRSALEEVAAPDVQHADQGTCDAARLALSMYHHRFGYPFVTGIETPTAEELLMRIRIRLGNEPTPEWRATREHLRRHVRGCVSRAAPPGPRVSG